MKNIQLINAAAAVATVVLLSMSCIAAPKAPTKSADPATQAGHDLFDQTCVTCHGPNAIGGEGPNLHNIGWTPDQVTAQIVHGTPGDMPAFGKRFDSGQIKSLVAYVRSLH